MLAALEYPEDISRLIIADVAPVPTIRSENWDSISNIVGHLMSDYHCTH